MIGMKNNQAKLWHNSASSSILSLTEVQLQTAPNKSRGQLVNLEKKLWAGIQFLENSSHLMPKLRIPETIALFLHASSLLDT
jgi:hypothetical protein